MLAQENGGHLLVGPSDYWRGTIDGKEDASVIGFGEAVYAFKDNRLAAFDTFAMLIPETSSLNPNEFELLVSRESSSGPFDSIGKFHTQNLRNFAEPYQTFAFPLVEAKYLKFKVISNHGASIAFAYTYEIQLLGTLVGSP